MEGCRIERGIGRPRECAKWLKRSAEHAAARSPRALRELILLYKKGLNDAVFADHEYTAGLQGRTLEHGHSAGAYKLGER